MASVLALGLDPDFADFTSMPGLTPGLVRNFVTGLPIPASLPDCRLKLVPA